MTRRILLSQEEANELTQQAVEWASSHGLVVQSEGKANYTHVGLSLLPTKFPRREFDKAVSLSSLFSSLVHRISLEHDWLHSSLQSVLETDKFTANLLKISTQVHAEGISQTAQLGVFRSDYMLHKNQTNNQYIIKQVELNTISSAFGCLSSVLTNMHRYISEYPTVLNHYDSGKTTTSNLPINLAMKELPKALAKAHEYYNINNAVVLFVVQANEKNSVDQRMLEYELWKTFKVKVLRKTLEQINSTAKLLGDNKRLFIDNYEVSVVYFRAGYTPTDYPQQIMWDARLLLERSKAIKCPSIDYHLAGAKKVQQLLADTKNLTKFADLNECNRLQEVFTGLYGLEKGSRETKEIIRKVRSNPAHYVMKPQREGGGNNFYGEEIIEALNTMSEEEIASFIIMDRIFPPSNHAFLLRNGTLLSGDTVSELGIYSVCLFDDKKEIFNSCAGHLLRTKLQETNEGGVASGFAVLSSPYLEEDDMN